MYICIEKNPDGSHAFQCGGHLENGWAVIPYDMEIPDTFPYVDIEVDTVTRPSIDGGVDITRLEVISMTEGKKIANQEETLKPVPSPTLESRVETLETTTDDMILLMADLIGGE